MNVSEMADQLKIRPLIDRALTYRSLSVGPNLLATPVAWSNKLQTSAGYASHSRGISLHPGLKLQGLSETAKTFLHEVAHIMQYLEYGKIDHGITWYEMMHQLGQPPIRCHSLKIKGTARAELTEAELLASLGV